MKFPNVSLEHLVGQCVSPLSFAVYGATSIAKTLPTVPAICDLTDYPWVGTGESNSGSPVAEWMKRNITAEAIKMTADTFPGMQACIESGAIGVLPCCLGDKSNHMQRLLPAIAEMETSVWVLVHPDLRKSAKIAAFTKHVSKRLREKSNLLGTD